MKSIKIAIAAAAILALPLISFSAGEGCKCGGKEKCTKCCGEGKCKDCTKDCCKK